MVADWRDEGAHKGRPYRLCDVGAILVGAHVAYHYNAVSPLVLRQH